MWADRKQAHPTGDGALLARPSLFVWFACFVVPTAVWLCCSSVGDRCGYPPSLRLVIQPFRRKQDSDGIFRQALRDNLHAPGALKSRRRSAGQADNEICRMLRRRVEADDIVIRVLLDAHRVIIQSGNNGRAFSPLDRIDHRHEMPVRRRCLVIDPNRVGPISQIFDGPNSPVVRASVILTVERIHQRVTERV